MTTRRWRMRLAQLALAGAATVALLVSIDQPGYPASAVATGGLGGIALDGDDDEAQLAQQQALQQMQQAEQQAEQQEQLDLQQTLQDEQQGLLTEQQATLSVPGS